MNNQSKDGVKELTGHKSECKLLSDIFRENFPEYFEANFNHADDSSRCFEKIVSSILFKALKSSYDAIKIIFACKVVNDIFNQYMHRVHEEKNPFLKSIQDFASLLFQHLVNNNLKKSKTMKNAVLVLGLLYENEFLTNPMILKCLSTFLNIAETKQKFLRCFCKLLLKIKEKLSETPAGVKILAEVMSRFKIFIASKKVDLSPNSKTPNYVLKLHAIATTINLQQLKYPQASMPTSSVSAFENCFPATSAINNDRVEKFDSFLKSIIMFKDQICSSSHQEKFYHIMTKGLIEWQNFSMRENHINMDTIGFFCNFEISLLESNVSIFRHRYNLTFLEDTDQILICQSELKILRSSYHLRNRILESTKFLASLYNTNKVDESLIMRVFQLMLSYEVLSNLSLECACNLLFLILPKFITSDYGIEAVTFIINNIQKVVKDAKCNARVKFSLIDLIKNINRFFPYIHIENNSMFIKQNLINFPLKATLSTTKRLW